jgi:hypothetical protein
MGCSSDIFASEKVVVILMCLSLVVAGSLVFIHSTRQMHPDLYITPSVNDSVF